MKTGPPPPLLRALLLAGTLSVSGCGWLLPALDVVFNALAPFTVNTPGTSNLLGYSMGPADPRELRERIELQPGFSIAVYAELTYPRTLRFSPGGHLLVTQPRQGKLVLYEPDRDGDGAPDGRRLLLEDIGETFGLEFHEGWLYLGEKGSLSRIRFDSERGAVVGARQVIAELPRTYHSNRSVRVGPDGWIYVGVGSNCNVCEPLHPFESKLLRFRPDGSEGEVVAGGIRSSSGFDWHPETGVLYAVEAGRDLLGDDFPPEELNRIVPGGFYGFPYLHGDNVADPQHGEKRPDLTASAIAPVLSLPPHTTPLSLQFLRGQSLPAEYRGAALMALHGSWNRSVKIGYSIVQLRWKPDGSIEQSSFANGFEKDGDVIGRPVDVAEGPDGAIYVTDDYAGAVYRIAYDAAAERG